MAGHRRRFECRRHAHWRTGPSSRKGHAAPFSAGEPDTAADAPRPTESQGAKAIKRRSRLNGLITAFVGSGARTGTMSAPTETMRATLAEAKTDLAAIEKEITQRRIW
ncbi:MAG: hypothetical protein AUH72_09270 [Acidobacteria bacterium 13_1_40CM_4_65_8]|nr:MAG: hypothetical protein AUH72_09270 [Acidobacteria bacterium 13_1_40CM_4_65_8]